MLRHMTYHPQTETITCIHSLRNTMPGAIPTILLCSDALVQLPIFTNCFVAGPLLANGKSKLALLKSWHTIFLTMLETGLRCRMKTFFINIFKDDHSDLKVLMESIDDDDTDEEATLKGLFSRQRLRLYLALYRSYLMKYHMFIATEY
jgi:hypothetical protein